MDLSQLKEEFFKVYNSKVGDLAIFFAPGRVNLIGEHTDYNDGFVLPAALNYGTYLLVKTNNENIIRLKSLNLGFTAEISSSDIKRDEEGAWINYPLGVIDQFARKGFACPGIDLLFYGDIPNGAGLSSSASIEMVTAVALNKITGAGFPVIDLVKMSQAAENDFVGMNCGIMDQFAVGFGKKDMAIFLNCGTLRYDTVPLILNEYRLVIANTNKRRGLTDSKYNERRSECEAAVKALGNKLDIKSLGDIGPDDISIVKENIRDKTILKRAMHVITEDARVLEAVRALHTGNLTEFGRQMNLSHDSLKNDYEVTGFELDTMVYEARKLKGVIGSRMTGAGFGGCTVSLVHYLHVEDFIKTLAEKYQAITGIEPTFYQPLIGDGAGELNP